MKNQKKVKSSAFHLFSLVFILCALVMVCCGCQQMGETTAEGHRRHLRNVRINQQQLTEDTDYLMLSDQPSKLTDKRIP